VGSLKHTTSVGPGFLFLGYTAGVDKRVFRRVLYSYVHENLCARRGLFLVS
jgi:hypothetical protein